MPLLSSFLIPALCLLQSAVQVDTVRADAGRPSSQAIELAAALVNPDSRLPCDTWVALPDATSIGRTILAKNSDRPQFDCQPLLLHPRSKWPEGTRIDLGRLSIPQVDETYATLGSSPYWCWGYEEGINEFGVAIGNEGVWSKQMPADLAAHRDGTGPQSGPTGMDLLRLGLERGSTAREALQVITKLLSEYGQFGSGMPTADVAVGGYENSFILADPKEAWILETFGRQWVARRLERGTASISNTLSISTEWDSASTDLEAWAQSRGWWSPEQGGLNFAAVFADDTPANAGRIVRARTRAACSAGLLKQKLGAIDPAWMMRIARDRSTTPSLDLDQTASSCVAVLGDAAETLPVLWWCPTTPSNSCYIPFFVHGDSLPEIVSQAGSAGRRVLPPSQAQPDGFSEGSYWWRFRELCDQVRLDYAERNPIVRAAFDPLEQQFAARLPEVVRKAQSLHREGKTAECARVLDAFSEACLEQVLVQVDALRERFGGESQSVPPELRPLVGEYIATVNGERVQIVVQDGKLAVDLPGKGLFQLREPDERGRRAFVLTDQVAISFDYDDFGSVVGIRLHQQGLAFELIRAGVTLAPEIPLSELQMYLGQYHSEQSGVDVTVLIQNNRLAVDWPEQMVFELHTPDQNGLWSFRLGTVSAVRFSVDPQGRVKSMTLLREGEVQEVLPRNHSKESPQ